MLNRLIVFGATNIAVIALFMVISSIFGLGSYITSSGLNLESLFFFALIFGFGGAFVSLLLSKWTAKKLYRIQMIESPTTAHEKWLFETVEKHAKNMGVKMPEVGYYQSPELNAFATGSNRNNSLVAFSSGLLGGMSQDEAEGVIAHEVAHIANGDMVTMALIQGVVNTFVIFFARIAAYAVSTMGQRDDDEGEGFSHLTFMLTSIVFEIIFGIFAQVIVCWFSKQREYKADAMSAKSAGKSKMIDALKKLQQTYEQTDDQVAPQLSTMKISSKSTILGFLSSHPPLESRIQKLEELN